MATVILWCLSITLIVLGVAGTILPALPGVALVFGAAIGEYVAQRDVRRAGNAGIATWLGPLLGTAAKIAIVFAMVGIFVFALIV